MPDESSSLYGRNQALSLVREFMTRPEERGYPTSRHTPVTVFTGPKGCGKTAFLKELEKGLKNRVPHARIDCAKLTNAAAWKVLPHLMFELNRTAAGYGTIPFPRFVAAQVVIVEKLSLLDVPNARNQVRTALERHRKIDKMQEFLEARAEDAARAVLGAVPGAPETVRYAPRLIMRGLISWRPLRRVMLGEGPDWYGDGKHAYDELIRLNRATRPNATDEDKQEATELLWAAFLADLNAAFGKGRGKRSWSLNCVILLDNIDTEPGRLMLKTLTDARRGRPDPLTVVTTSAGAVAEHLARGESIPFAEDAGYEDFKRRTPVRDSYPVRLRDLTLDEVTDMVSAVGVSWLGARRSLAASVYRLTHGHPAATNVVISAIGDSHSRPSSLRALLKENWRGPVDETVSSTVEERMLREFVDGTAKEPADRLMVCSAARDVEQAEELSRSGLVPPPHDGDEIVPAELQVEDPDTGRMTMLPVLRTLLLRRLAADRRKWTATHEWLRENGRQADKPYHALANHDITSVAERLSGMLGDADTWFAELRSITAAPNDLDTDEADPDRVLAAAGWAGPADGPERTIARIVAALWTANDPLSTADRGELLSSAAWDVKELAQAPRAERVAFRREAGKLERRAESAEEAGAGQPVRDVPRPAMAPPKTSGARRRTILLAVAAGAVVAVAAGVAAPPILDLIGRCGEGVYEVNGECVGVTDGSYVFNESLADISKKILDENARVQEQPHVSVAVLTPMIPTDVGSVTWQRIRAPLEGAHVAQLAANKDKREPKVKLLLANPGSAQQEWSRVVDQLAEKIDGDNLVGVVGVGQSTVNTQDTARALAAKILPMIGSVVTATGFNIDQKTAQDGQPRYIEGFARVNTTTGDQIGVLADYLGRAGVGKAILVYDINEQDLYTSTLYKEFKAAANGGKGPAITVESRFDTETSLQSQFREIMKDLCGDGAPDTVLYAGRAVLLDDLITNLRERGCARDRKITLVTGSDASMLRTRKDLRPEEGDPALSIVYTPHVDPDAARQAGITEFDTLAAEFEHLGFDKTDLDDGWAVMMHDAMLTAAEAINRAGNQLKAGELPSRQAVRAELARTDRERNAIRGAGGTFTLNSTTGDSAGRRLPVMEVTPNGEFTVKAIVDVPAR